MIFVKAFLKFRLKKWVSANPPDLKSSYHFSSKLKEMRYSVNAIHYALPNGGITQPCTKKCMDRLLRNDALGGLLCNDGIF